MKKIYIFSLIGLLLHCALPSAGQEDKTTFKQVHKSLWYDANCSADQDKTKGDQPSDSVHLFTGRYALVGAHCMINRTYSTVSVGSFTNHLEYLTDDTLTNHTTMNNVASVQLGYKPQVSVRDMEHHFAKGTTAGFCLASKGTQSVLSLDLANTFVIRFYREGKAVGLVNATSGKDIKGLKLSLISLPSSDNLVYNIEATAPEEFDEVEFGVAGAASVDVASLLKLKYAYVGTSKMYTLTNREADGKKYAKRNTIPDFRDYLNDNGRDENVTIERGTSVLGWKDRAINSNLDDGFGIVLPVKVGWGGGMSIYAIPKDGKGEFFKKGSIVGIDMSAGGVDIDVASGVKFDLLDSLGNTIKNASHTMGDGVLGVDLGGGDRSVTMEAESDFSGVQVNFLKVLGVDLSATILKYAFVCPAPKLFPDAHHCPIEASADLRLCNRETSITLFHNEAMPVTWSLESVKYASTQTKEEKPVIDTNTGEVTNIQYDGIYVFKAKAADGCYETVTVTKGDPEKDKDAGCERVISNTDAELADTKAKDGSSDTQEDQTKGGGSLLSISGWSKDHPKENILDGHADTYAEYTEGLKLADNVRVITVKTKTLADGTQPSFQDLMVSNATDKDAAKQDSICVGFVMQMQSTGLDLKLLQGFRIECYNKDGKRVYRHFVSQSNVLGLQLIGSNKVQKLEFAVTVPKDSTFCSYSLWTTGVLGLDISHLRIYYPFYERGSEVANCSNPIGCGAVQISNTQTGAKIFTGGQSVDASKTGSIGTVDLASMMQDLSNIVDDDPDYKTCAKLGGVLTVGHSYQVGIKMGRTYGSRQRLTIVMDTPNNILTANVGGWMTIETYYKGQPTGYKKTDWKVLGLDLIKSGDRAYYILSPTSEYDEVMITFNGVAGVADFHNIYGIAVQSDINGNGIPDCRDDNSCSTPLVTDVKMEPACQYGSTTITWKGLQNQNYVVYLPEQGNKMLATKLSGEKGYKFSGKLITDDKESRWQYTFTVPADTVLKNYGNRFTVYIESVDTAQLASANYIVHPLITHWLKDAPNTNWNEWGNWKEGSPFYCSDVIIPTDAKRYPVLTAITDDDKKKLTQTDQNNWNKCNGIHFCPDAAVENIQKLTYDSAWVDLGLKTGVYRMFMTPLRSVYSGDFFVSELPESKYFTKLTDSNDPENRTAPYVYQRLWDKVRDNQYQLDASGINTSGTYDLLNTQEASWSQAFNYMQTNYSAWDSSSKNAPDCFTLMVDNRNMDNAVLDVNKTYVIHLPKEGTRNYYYRNYDGTKASETAYPVEHSDNPYKLFGNLLWESTETSITMHYQCDQTSSVEKTNGATVFLVGNPMMSHLSLTPFITANATTNSTGGFYSKNIPVTGVKVYDGNTTYSVIVVGTKPVSTSADKPLYVGPSQAFFIEMKQALTTVNVEYNTSMYGSQPTGYDQTYHSGNAPAAAKALNTSDDEPSYLRVKASNGQNNVSTILLQGIDQKATTLIDEKYKPNLAAFSMEGNQAYDIRPVDADVIDLGFYTSDSCDVQLSFETSGNFNTDDWRLYDRSTDNCYRLDETPVVTMNGANVGRFYLSRIGAVTKIHQAKAADGVTLTVAKGVATVKSLSNDLSAVYVYDEDGSLVDEKILSNASQATLHVAPGVNIVKVCRAGKADKSYKVMGR